MYLSLSSSIFEAVLLSVALASLRDPTPSFDLRLDIAFATFDPTGLNLPTFFSGRAPTYVSEITSVSFLTSGIMVC